MQPDEGILITGTGITVAWKKHARCAAEWLALRAEYQKATENLDAATTVISARLKARRAPSKAELKAEARARRRLAGVRRRLIVYAPGT
jgi:hypothetical protein